MKTERVNRIKSHAEDLRDQGNFQLGNDVEEMLLECLRLNSHVEQLEDSLKANGDMTSRLNERYQELVGRQR